MHWQDLLALTEHLDGQEPVLSGVVANDHLKAAAAELEETVATVRARLERYAGMLDLCFETSDIGSEDAIVD